MYIVLGYGKTGKSVCSFLKKQNYNFLVYDPNNKLNPSSYPEITNNIIYQLPKEKLQIKAIIASPGISIKYNNDSEISHFVEGTNISVISDLQLFMQNFPKKKYIGITGTNGKSTTSTLVYQVLKNAGFNVALSGNIGISPFENAIDADICVFEVSSFQLEITNNVEFEISAITNITPDHLDRYQTIKYYKKEKLHIAKISKKCVVNANIRASVTNAVRFSTRKQIEGYYIKNSDIFLGKKKISALPHPKTPQNLENIMTAFSICHEYKVSDDIIFDAISNFAGIEHRVEFITNKHGVNFYNDSKATNLCSTYNALSTVDGDIILIAGGILVDDISGVFSKKEFKKVKIIALIGSASEKIANELEKYNKGANRKIEYLLCDNLENATKTCFHKAMNLKNANVLLSPFCKSFDQFKNFEERGILFKKYVSSLV